MQRPQVCASCHATNEAMLRFCTSCGSALGITCEKCGSIGRFEDRFCGICGTALHDIPARTEKSKTLRAFEAAVAVSQYSIADIEELLQLRASLNTERNANISMGQGDIDQLFVQP